MPNKTNSKSLIFDRKQHARHIFIGMLPKRLKLNRRIHQHQRQHHNFIDTFFFPRSNFKNNNQNYSAQLPCTLSIAEPINHVQIGGSDIIRYPSRLGKNHSHTENLIRFRVRSKLAAAPWNGFETLKSFAIQMMVRFCVRPRWMAVNFDGD